MTDSSAAERADNGLVLPLANLKNQQLQAKITAKRQKLAQLALEVDQNDNLYKNEELEVVSLEQDNFQNTNLRNILRSQCQKEREAIKLARTEAENVDQEGKNLRKALEELKQLHNRQKARLHEQKNDLERLRKLFEDESKIVETMQSLVKSQEEDQFTLEKYAAQDDSMIKDLELKLKRAKEDIYEAEKMFEAAKEERKNAAVQLHQMQEEFAALLDDRDSGLKRSEATTQQTESCRRLLENAQKEYQLLKEQVSADQERLDGINRCTKHFREDITGLERALQTREAFASQLKLSNDSLENDIALQQSEMKTFKKVIKRVVKDIIATRSASDELRKGIDELKGKLASEQDKFKCLEQELKKARDTVNTSQAQKESLARLAKAADDQLNKQNLRINQLAIEQAGYESEIKAKLSSLNNIFVQIRNTVASIGEIEKEIELAEQQIKQQNESVYKKNMEILRTELELRRFHRNDGLYEERKELRKKIDELKKEVEATNCYYVSLKNELLKTQSDAIGLQRSCDIQQERQNVLKTLAQHLQSECHAYSKESNNLRRDLEEIRMNESLLHLEIKRKESMIQARASTVQKLENQKRDIEKAIETRYQELMNETELLQLDCRSLKERNQQLLMELNQKAAEIERIKLRYRLVAASLETESKNHEASEAYFIIKMVQEKEEIKETIEDLRYRVSKLESENDALGNTIKLVASSNKHFRQNTILGLLSDDDKILKKNMETESHELQLKIAALKKEIAQGSNRVEALEDEINQLKEESYHMKFALEEKEVVHKEAYDELMQFSLKIERAKQVNALMQKQVRKARKAKCKLEEEIEFQTVILREKWLSAQTSIFNLAQNDADAKENLLQLLEEMASGIAHEVKKPQVAAVAPKIRLDITNFPTTVTATRRSPTFSGNSCLSGMEQTSFHKADASDN